MLLADGREGSREVEEDTAMATRKFQNDFVVVEEGKNWHHHIKKSREGVSGMLNSFESELAFILLDF